MTIFGPVSLTIFAVRPRMMVRGAAPQLNVTTPPLATALTNASPVQLSGAPLPTTVRGAATLSGCASAGTSHLPSGLPGAGVSPGAVPPVPATPEPAVPPEPDAPPELDVPPPPAEPPPPLVPPAPLPLPPLPPRPGTITSASVSPPTEAPQ